MSIRPSRTAVLAALMLGLAATQCDVIIGLDKFRDCTTDCTGSGGAAGASHAASTTQAASTTNATTASTSAGTGGAKVCSPGATMKCPYMGTPGTEGIGDCKAGKATCAADGSGYGPCMGEVDPDPKGENCYKLGDENCDGIACSDPVVTSLYGDASDQHTTSMTVDKDGNILIAGYFQGVMTFGTQTITSMGSNDYFVAKFDPSGIPLWARRYGDAVNNGVTLYVTTDSAGNVILSGDFTGQLDFGACGFVSSNKPFATTVLVAKLSPQGNCQWASTFGNGVGSGQRASGAATTATGDIVIAGSFDGSIKFGSAATVPTLSVTTSGGYPDMFLAKLGPDGSYAWSKKFSDPSSPMPTSSRGAGTPYVDSATGHIYLSGGFTGKLALGTTTLSYTGSGGALFLSKFDVDGSTLAAKHFGGETGYSGTVGMAVSSDRVIITGNMGDHVDFGGGPLPLQGLYDGFIAVFDLSLLHQWSMRFGDPNDMGGSNVDTGTSVASDKDGNVLLTGYVYGQLSFPGGPMLNAQGGADVFLAKFDPTGKLLWNKIFGDSTNQFSAGVGANPMTKDVVLAGSTQGSIDFGTGNKTSAGGYDVFLATFQP